MVVLPFVPVIAAMGTRPEAPGGNNMSMTGAATSRGAPSLGAEAEIPEVARLMTDYNLISLPVVDAESRPIGVVSVDDILELTLPEQWRRRYGLARE